MNLRSIALILLLAFVLCAVGCSSSGKGTETIASDVTTTVLEELATTQREEDPESPESTPAETESTETVVETEFETEPVTMEPETTAPVTESVDLSTEAQLALILANRELWSNDEELFSTYYSYCVTDLDLNGRLEIQFGACVGTGFFTYMGIWEVNEDGTALIPVERNEADVYYSQADVICDEVKVFYDPNQGIYNYIFEDYSRNGYAWSGTDIRALNLQKGFVREETLGSYIIEIDLNENVTETYYGADGAEISAEEYASLPDVVFEGKNAMQAKFCWQHTSAEEFAVLTDSDLLNLLREAQTGFSVG